jgi:hypothetical protein
LYIYNRRLSNMVIIAMLSACWTATGGGEGEPASLVHALDLFPVLG